MRIKIICGFALLICSMSSFACDEYIRSLPYTIDEDGKEYCVQGPRGGTLYFDASTAPLLHYTIWSGTSHDGNSIMAYVRPAINIQANDITLRFLSKVQNTNPQKIYDEIDVGIFSGGGFGVDNIDIIDAKLKDFSVGTYIVGVDEVKISNAMLQKMHFTGISIELAKNVTILDSRVEALSTDMSYPNANLFAINVGLEASGEASLRDVTVDRFFNTSTSAYADNVGIRVRGGADADVELVDPFINSISGSESLGVDSRAIEVMCFSGCTANIIDGYLGEKYVIASGNPAISLFGRFNSFEVVDVKFRYWSKALYVQDHPDTLGYFADNEALVYKKNGNSYYPSYDQVFDVSEGTVDGGNNRVSQR